MVKLMLSYCFGQLALGFAVDPLKHSVELVQACCPEG
jgi:hypothetical protein